MKLKTMIVCACLTAFPLFANAGDLKIANKTKYDLSFRINNVCSDKFDGFGLIPAGMIKVISEQGFNKECEYNPKYCVAHVYIKANCKGEDVAEIGFNTDYGVSTVGGTTSIPVTITASGFNLLFASPIKK